MQSDNLYNVQRIDTMHRQKVDTIQTDSWYNAQKDSSYSTDSWYNADRQLIQYTRLHSYKAELIQCRQTVHKMQTVDIIHRQTIDTYRQFILCVQLIQCTDSCTIHGQLIQCTQLVQDTVDTMQTVDTMRRDSWYSTQTVDTMHRADTMLTDSSYNAQTVDTMHRVDSVRCSQTVHTMQTQQQQVDFITHYKLLSWHNTQ